MTSNDEFTNKKLTSFEVIWRVIWRHLTSLLQSKVFHCKTIQQKISFIIKTFTEIWSGNFEKNVFLQKIPKKKFQKIKVQIMKLPENPVFMTGY